MSKPLRKDVETPILYCRCAYARVIPFEVKEAVLKALSESGVPFEAVPDLCEMSAQKDRSLKRLAERKELRIGACFPRAVQWLFHAAGTPLDADRVEIVNMREMSAEEVVKRLLRTASVGEDTSDG